MDQMLVLHLGDSILNKIRPNKQKTQPSGSLYLTWTDNKQTVYVECTASADIKK